MKLLETHGCQGCAHVGYVRAGWDVTGVDTDRRHAKYYPGRLVIADAATYIREHGHEYDAIHTSPPCQWYTRGNAKGRATGNSKWQRSIPPIREALESIGRPYVIENVTDAGWDMRNPVALCGCMFNLSTIDTDGIRIHLKRERLFETNWPLSAPRPCNPRWDRVVGRSLRRCAPRQVRSQVRPQGRLRAARQGNRESAARRRARHHLGRPLRGPAARLHRAHWRRPSRPLEHGGRCMSAHVYNSGVGFDTAPGDPIYPCCPEPISAPVHDVTCDRCGEQKTARHDCWMEQRRKARTLAADLDRVRRSVNPEAYWRDRAEVAEAGLAEARATALREAADAVERIDDQCQVSRTCHIADALLLRARANRETQ